MSALLQTVSFKDALNWSVAHLMESQFNYNKEYELVRIGNFLTRNKNRINIEDDVEYKRVTIRMKNKGIRLRDRVMGRDIGTKKQFLIKEGQFLLSKIDARNGAFGLATNEVDGAIITADFFAYEIDKSKIEPYFLVLLTTTKKFQKFAQGASRGTTGRQRIDEKSFLDVKIPLPSLEKQKEIVESYQAKVYLADSQDKEVLQKNNTIKNYLYSELGIEIKNNAKSEKKILDFVNFKNINEWDIGNINSKDTMIFNNSKTIPFYKILKLQSGNFLPSSKQNNGKYIVYGGNGQNGFHNKFNKFGQRILIGRVGEYCGNIHLVCGEYWVTDNVFFSEIIYDTINIQYLVEILKLLNLNQYKNISGQPSLSQKNIKNINIPILPLSIQNKIATHIQTLKDEIKELKEKAERNRVLALSEFEEGIFSEA